MPVDAKGKKLRELSGRGIMFRDVKLAHPDWSDKRCAEEIGGASYTTIAGWKRHPQYRGTVGYFAQKALEKASVGLERTIAELARIGYSDLRKVAEWGADGVTLKASSELDDDAAAGVAEVTEVLGKEGVRGVRVKMHSKPEALAALLRYFAPEKAAVGDTYNFNGPNPFSGWGLEELAAWREERRAKLVEGKVVNQDSS